MIVVIGIPRVDAGLGSGQPAGTVAAAALAAAGRGAAVQLVGRIGDDETGDALLVALARGGVGHAAVLRDPARRTPALAQQVPDDDVGIEEHVADAADAEPPESEPPAAEPPESAPPAAEPPEAHPSEAEPPAAEPPEPDGSGPPSGASSAAGEPTLDAADVDLGLRYLADFRVLLAAEPLPPAVIPVLADAAAYAGAELVLVTAPGEPPPAGVPAGALVLEGPVGVSEGGFGRLLGELAAMIDGGASARDALRAATAAVGATGPGP